MANPSITGTSGGTGQVAHWATLGLGLSVTVPLCVAVLPLRILHSGFEPPMGAFAITLVALAPLLFLSYEFALFSPRQAGVLSVASRLGLPPLAFAAGWFSTAGYALIAALLIQRLAALVHILIEGVIPIDIGESGTLVAVGAIIFAREALARRGWWGARSAAVFLFCLALTGLLAYEYFNFFRAQPPSTFETKLDRPFAIIGVVACLMWAVDAIFVHQGQLRTRGRGAASTAALALGIGALVGTLVIALTRHMPAVFGTLGEQTELSWDGHWALATALLTLIPLILEGSSRMLRSAQRVVGTLVPPSEHDESPALRQNLVLFALVVAAVGSSRFFSQMALTSAAGAAYLWTLTLVSLPLVFSAKAAKRLTGPSKSSLLRPTASVALVVCIAVATLLPWSMIWGMVVWTGIGLIGYLLSPSLRGDREAEDEARAWLDSDGFDERSAVGVVTAQCDLPSLIRLTRHWAKAASCRALLLEVVPFDEKLSAWQMNRLASRRFSALRAAIEELGEAGAEVAVAVKLAPSPLDTLREYEEKKLIHAVILSSRRHHENGDEARTDLELLFRGLAAPVLLNIGGFRNDHTNLLIYTPSTTTPATLARLGAHLGGREQEWKVLHDSSFKLQPATEDSNDGEQGDGEADDDVLRTRCEELRSEREIWKRLRNSPRTTLAFVESARDAVLGRATFGGRPFEEALRRRGPTIIYKPAEPPTGFLWRRFTEQLAELLPPMQDSDRAEVVTEQARAARASRDFRFLMIVASMIATAGLLANSTAVVIGAMLVAPLMQPIVALAMGVALASGPRLRRSAKSVAWGAATSVAVASIITMLFPIHEAPPEVMARTSPNLLDLLVALAAGAAASYASARKSIAGALPGVAISVALVPPLCVVGFGIGSGSWPIAQGASLLFLTNLAAIVLVSAALFMLFGFRPLQARRSQMVRTGLFVSLAGLLLVTIPLAVATFDSFESRLIQWRLNQARASIVGDTDLSVREINVRHRNRDFIAHVTLLSPEPLDEEQAKALKERLTLEARYAVEIELTVVIAQRF